MSSSETSLPPEKLDIIRELDEIFEGNKALIGAYLRRFGFARPLSTNVRIIKREFDEGLIENDEAIPDVADEGPDEGEGRSVFYGVDVHCLYCETRFQASMLRSKSLVLAYHYKNSLFPLMVPETQGAIKDYRPDDPLVRSVTVCPSCYYASSSIAYFATDSAMSASKGLLGRIGERKFKSIKEIVDGDRQARAEIFRSAMSPPEDEEPLPQTPTTGNFWDRSRTKAHAIIGYRLASHCASLLVEFDPPSAFYAAETLLSAAKLAHDIEAVEHEDTLLRMAVQYLEKYHEVGRSPSALGVYLLGVTHWHIKNAEEARTWVGRLLTGRGKYSDYHKFKNYAENLRDAIKEAHVLKPEIAVSDSAVSPS